MLIFLMLEFNFIKTYTKYLQDLRNCHNTRVVRDTTTMIITLKTQSSVTAPYSQNVPVA